ncbi:base excision DNA repair protein [Schaalia vaccimaxillae]|uniref:base excision DNA repair protein n=1 Tax=Schaalia vaccimaxillae TaxID=183916 RepID=UPI0004796250|nr:base excision DNA repair protein [Schaalia vaccimaxillae]
MRRVDVSPWATLVFEVMSQQTPIPRVEPIWLRWMQLWPTPSDLAVASAADVLVEWKHLGYPSRALRLRECAIAITRRPGGQVPASMDELLALPGIGPYTASALASFQFHARLPVLDTNVRRVITRIFKGKEFAPKASPSRQEIVHATSLLPELGVEAAQWNVALMEFGALHCTQRSPSCPTCPLVGDCAWARAGFPRSEVRPKGQAWKGTDRQARGKIMAALRALHVGKDQDLAPSTALPSVESLTLQEALATATLPGGSINQAQRVINGLLADGLISYDSETNAVTLPR